MFLFFSPITVNIGPDENGDAISKFKSLIQDHNHDHTPLVVTMRRYKVTKIPFNQSQDDDDKDDEDDGDEEKKEEDRLDFHFGSGPLGIGMFVGKEDKRIHITKVSGQVHRCRKLFSIFTHLDFRSLSYHIYISLFIAGLGARREGGRCGRECEWRLEPPTHTPLIFITLLYLFPQK